MENYEVTATVMLMNYHQFCTNETDAVVAANRLHRAGATDIRINGELLKWKEV